MVTNAAIVNTSSMDANASSQLVQTGSLFFDDSADLELAVTQAVKIQQATQTVETQ